MKFHVFITVLILQAVAAATAQSQALNDSTGKQYFDGFSTVNGFQVSRTGYNDSILIRTYFYDPLKYNETFVARSGNAGSASAPVFSFMNRLKPFDDGFDQFEGYRINPLHSGLTASERRFTRINYHIGSKKEQHIHLSHEQKFKPWMIAGIGFSALSSQGDFARQLNTNRGFNVYFKYESPGNVYRNQLSFTSNRILNQENGGITSDSVFENASSLNTRTLPIYLPAASIRHRTRDYMLKQEINISRLFAPADSSERLRPFKEAAFTVTHSFWWSRKSVLFTSSNPDSGYFKNIFVDSASTYDSTFYNDVYQVAMLEYHSRPTAAGSHFHFGAGFETQYVDYTTGPVDTSVMVGGLVIQAGYETRRMITRLSFSKTISGDASDGYRGSLHLDYSDRTGNLKIYADIFAGKLEQTFRDDRYYSNHFIWNNDFKMREIVDMTAGISSAKWKFNFLVQSQITRNLVFYREDFLPQSYADPVQVTRLKVSKILQAGKVGWDHSLTFSFSGNDQVVPVPLFSGLSSLYYQNRFFRNVLGFRAGADVSYYSRYYGYGYMPATGVFYVQDDKKTGDYPQLGAFIHLNIKSKANLFIRLDHFNAGIGDRTYYGALHYPLPGRTFKFGVIWDLVD